MSNLPSIPWTERERAEIKKRLLALEAGGGGGGGPVAWVDITGKPTTFTPSAHTHVIADVTGLQTALDGKQPVGAYETTSQLDTRDTNNRARANHTGTQDATTITGTKTSSFISDFASAVAALITGKANTVHTHVISDTTGLQTALDGKAATSHTHTASQVTDFSEAVDDRVAALLVAGANVSMTYDDVANTLTIASTGGGGGSSLSPALAWVI